MDGLSITVAVAAGCVVGSVLLVLARALREERARSARGETPAARRDKRSALICLEGGGHVASRDVLERAAARRGSLRSVSRDDVGQKRRQPRLHLVVTTMSAESLTRVRRRRPAGRRCAKTDAGQQSHIHPIGLHPLAG
jgi:hypothetical protein